MTAHLNSPRAREALKLITAAGFGGLLMLVWVITYDNPEQAYVAADSLIMVCMVLSVLAGSLWMLLDMDKNTEIDIREKL